METVAALGLVLFVVALIGSASSKNNDEASGCLIVAGIGLFMLLGVFALISV